MRSDVALVTADCHIIECRNRVAHQIKRIRAMERHGADTRLARKLLDTMRQSLACHERYREGILDLLARDGPTIHA